MSLPISFLFLENFFIEDLLKLEEALLRTNNKNWCIVCHGTPRAIVLGLSNQVEDFVHLDNMQKNPLPVIKRFSGGGTVIVGPDTIFVSFIFSKNEKTFKAFDQKKTHDFIANFYAHVFDENFQFLENDYVYQGKKIGGNAQYFTKNRILHHTSFLWDFDPKDMELLLIPKKTPLYRNGRSHQEFLTRLKKIFLRKNLFLQKIQKALQSHFSPIKEVLEKDLFKKKFPNHLSLTKNLKF